MAIPLQTTTIEIKGVRPESSADPEADGYGFATPPGATVVATNVRAVVSQPRGYRAFSSESGQPQAETDTWQLRADPCDLRKDDVVKDLTTNRIYHVETVVHSRITAYGLDHVHAQLFEVSGVPS